MTSRTSCFDRTLFSKTLRRFWPLWTAYLLAWLLALPLPLHIAANSTYLETALNVRMQETVYNLLHYLAPFTVLWIAPLTAMAVFGYLYGGKSAGVFASLPVKREASFLSLTLAGLAPLLAVPVVTAAVAGLVTAANGCFEWTPLLTFVGVMTLYTLNFYGFAVLCAQLTGLAPIVPVVYMLLSFTAPVVEFIVSVLVAAFVYGYQGAYIGFGAYLSPFSAIQRFTRVDPIGAKEEMLGWTYHGWGINAIYAAVGVAMLVLALLLYRRRRIETAGDVVAVRPLKKVFSFALGAGCALVLSMLLTVIFQAVGNTGVSCFAVAAVGLTVGGFVGYFGAEMLTHKTFRVFGASWRGFAVLFAVLTVFLCAMRFDVFNLERGLPKAEAVQSVNVNVDGYDATLSQRENVEAVLRINEDVLEHRTDSDLTSLGVRVSYDLGNGRFFERYYDLVPTSEGGDEDGLRIEQALSAVFNTDEAITQRFPTDVTKTQFHYTDVNYSTGEDYYNQTRQLSPEETYEWYTTCILPDVADGTLGIAAVGSHEQDSAVYCYVEIYDEPEMYDGMPYAVENYRSVWIEPTRKSVRTTQWLEAHGVTLKPAES